MLPEAFLARMQDMLGQEYPDYLASLERPQQRGLRLGRKGQGREIPFSLEPIPWEKNGGYYDEAQRPGKHPWHEAGAYYLQEPSAMAPGALLRPVPGERVLDLCAAPGGKATQLAEYLQGQGILVANEIQPKRAKILSRNIERMGIPNALVLNMHPEALARRFSGWFHRVLVDAPCSGEGMFRKDPSMVYAWKESLPKEYSRLQADIVEHAVKMLKPGGYMLYSTCTFSPLEDEMTVSKILDKGQMSLEDMEELTGESTAYDVCELSISGTSDELNDIKDEITDSVEGVTARLVKKVTESETTVLSKLQALVLLVTVVVLALTMICVATTMTAVVAERRKEIGLRKALGASDSSIVYEFIGEGIVLGAVGGLLGAILGFIFAQAVSLNVFGRSISFHPLLIPFTIVVSVAITAAACLLPIKSATDVDPALVLKGE